MKSMTGYGKCSVAKHDRVLTIELKTVNNRFLDVNPHMPKIFACCEDIVRKTLKGELSRGNVDVYFDYENNSEKLMEKIKAMVPTFNHEVIDYH